MVVTGSVTSISWIPSEAVEGATRVSFDLGVTHYDEPPPDVITDVERLRDADGFRFANRLSLSAEFDGDRVVAHEVTGGVVMGATTVRVARLGATFQAVTLPDLRSDVETGPGWARVTQTCGGRTALPLPRPVRHPPFVKLQAPIVWTTLTLVVHSDGRSEFTLAGASAFPRHWVYGSDGRLALKAGSADYKQWTRHSFGRRTPWGDHDAAVLVTAAETALERELSRDVMHGPSAPIVRTLRPGDQLARQGDDGGDVFLVLDGVVSVTVDGVQVGEVGPGAVLGERAALETGRRTATLTAVTAARIAAVSATALRRDRLHELATGHRRESARD
jgi:hypothetical protein